MNKKETSHQHLALLISPSGSDGILFRSAGCADAQNIYSNSRDLKTFKRTLPGQRQHLYTLRIEIGNPAAASTHQVIVLAFVGLHADRAMVHAHCPQHAALEERPHILIHRRQGDRRDLFLHRAVDQLRAGMAIQRHDGLVDYPPLVRRGQAVLAAEGAKFGSSYHWITLIKQEELLFVNPVNLCAVRGRGFCDF